MENQPIANKLAERKPFIVKKGENMSFYTNEIRDYINLHVNEDPQETELLFLELKKTFTDIFRDDMEEHDKKIDDTSTDPLVSMTNDRLGEYLTISNEILDSRIAKLKDLIKQVYKEKFNKELSIEL